MEKTSNKNLFGKTLNAEYTYPGQDCKDYDARCELEINEEGECDIIKDEYFDPSSEEWVSLKAGANWSKDEIESTFDINLD